MTLRVLIAGLEHETNTYCKETTPLTAFGRLRGERLIQTLADTRTDVGGMLAACEELGAEPSAGLFAMAQPSGTIAANAYRELRDEILADVERGDFDAVVLGLHGAGVVEEIDDLEADLCREIRARVGTQLPIAATFDLHGNVSQAMADALDGMFVCHEYPHTDLYERGREAVELVARVRAGELRPRSWVETLPILLPTSTTLFGPAKEVKDRCLALEAERGLIDCSFFHGFPYTDTPLVGSRITATADGDVELARKCAQEVAAYLWDKRDEFRPTSLSAQEAVEQALAAGEGPVVINETSDNPGGGTPGDGTHLLRALLDARVEDACFGFIVDPIAARLAHEAGVGETIEVELGGRYDELHGAPLPVRAYVKALSDGRFEWRSAMLAGLRANLGPTARLLVDGLDIIVGSQRSQTFGPGVFEHLGIDPTRYRLVALKSSNHFRAGFQELARAIVTADPPGLTTHRIEIFPRERAPGPLWPLDPDAAWSAGSGS